MTAKHTYPSEIIAKLVKKTARRVNQMAAEGLLTREADGRFDLWKVIPEYCEYLESRAAAPNLSEGKVRVTELQAALLELDLKERSGELVSANEAMALFEDALVRVRARVLSIPARAATELVGIKTTEVAFNIVEKIIHEALNEISKIQIDTNADKPRHTGDNAAAAKTEGEPVGRRKPKTKPRGKRGAGKVADRKG